MRARSRWLSVLLASAATGLFWAATGASATIATGTHTGAASEDHPAVSSNCPTAARTLVIVSLRTGATDCRFPDPGLTGCPYTIAVVSNGHGGWFVNCGHDGLEELDSTGIRDPHWQTHLPDVPAAPGADHVTALDLVGHTLYVGGLFGVEALNASTGTRIWFTRVKPNLDQAYPANAGVSALSVNADAVFAGGGFIAADGSPDQPLIAVDPRTGQVLPWKAPTLSPPVRANVADMASISALALDGTRLFIAGEGITAVNGSPRDDIAALNAVTGALLPWRPRPPAPGAALAEISGLLVTRGHVYASTGGTQNSTPGVVNESTGAIAPAPTACQVDCVVDGDILYAAEGMYSQDTLRARNLSSGRLIAWAPYINIDQQIGGMAISGDQMLVVGTFTKTLG